MLMKQVEEEIRLDQRSRVRIAPTAPARFQEREDIELAHRYHSLFNKPHVIEETPTCDDTELLTRLQKLGVEKNNTKKSKQDQQHEKPEEKEQTKPPTQNRELADLWSRFHLSELSEDEETLLSDEEFALEDEELLHVIQSALANE